MNKKIKLTSLLLALTLTLAACGNTDNENSNNESNDNQQTTEESSNTENSNDNKSDDKSNDDNTSDDSESDDNKNNESSNDSKSSDATSSDEIVVDDYDKTIEDAIKEAQSNFDGQLTEIGIDKKGNQWVYEVELESDSEEYDVGYDVNNLEVVKESREPENDPDDNEYFKYEDIVKIEDAINTAKGQVDGKVIEVGTDWDNGKLYYEVTILQSDNEDVDVIIDAMSGDFVEIDD